MAVLAGKKDLGDALAGKSTLNRMELTPAGSAAGERYHKIGYSAEAIDTLLVDLFLEAHRRAPREIVLDLDATDTPLHGRQEARFFHGYYGHYCYLPLYIFCGDHLLCARLRPSNIDASAGSLQEVQRMVQQIRARWPKTRIILRADSGFCREELLAWCENHQVDYVFGFARNQRLRRIIGRAMHEAKQEHRRTGKAARVFCEFAYRTKQSWSRKRRVIAKAEQIEGKENPRYLVTSLSAQDWPAQQLYEQLYCARGEMENRIKEQLSLFADRMSTETLRANQLRLYFSSLAYVLVEALRRLGLAGTEWAQAQADTIRLKLLKIAAQVRITARRIATVALIPGRIFSPQPGRPCAAERNAITKPRLALPQTVQVRLQNVSNGDRKNRQPSKQSKNNSVENIHQRKPASLTQSAPREKRRLDQVA